MKAIRKFYLRHGRLLAGGVLFLFVVGSLIVLPLQSAAQTPVVPTETPDAAVGLSIFQERCATCHGLEGNGDGELATRLPAPPRQFTDPAFYRTAVPALMYETISSGRIDAGMPPFGDGTSNPIPEANRWDLIAAVYSLAVPAETMEQGAAVYTDNCVACHGESGAGAGPDAENISTDLSDPVYWFDKSNEMVRTAVTNPDIPGHDAELSEDDQWAVVAYGRSLSFNYVDPFAPPEPIALGTISGVVTNGTTNTPLADEPVVLRAFNMSFEETLTLTSTLSVDGSYQFEVTDVPPDWVYLVSVAYDGLNFSSAAAQLTQAQAALELPIMVYEQTTDPSVVAIEQMHTILGFTDGALDVATLYVISNNSTAVFMGETGNPDEGTVKLFVPEGATAVEFQRAFGQQTSFLPATEVIATESSYADTFPLRPGTGTSNLLVTYQLPYDDGVSVSYALPYPVNSASVIMPDAGVTLNGTGWVSEGVSQTEMGTFVRYSNTAVQDTTTFSFTLEGKPRLVTDSAGNVVAPRSQSTELIIGGIGLLLAVAVVVFAVRGWQNRAIADEDSWDDEDEWDEEADSEDEKDALLQALADLDETYEAGELTDEAYNQQRDALKAQLLAVWDEEDE
ncbi:MAG: hypothetical protein Kow0080_17090 [Candidatus Promineifilaceae bacterium]